jgi:hypothetical protein
MTDQREIKIDAEFHHRIRYGMKPHPYQSQEIMKYLCVRPMIAISLSVAANDT